MSFLFHCNNNIGNCDELRTANVLLPRCARRVRLCSLHVESEILHSGATSGGNASISDGHAVEGGVRAAVDDDESVVVREDAV